MQRFVYTPRVEAFIRLEDSNRVIDVTEDIIDGSVTRRVDALSECSITLQNKNGKYTDRAKIKPMDRIIVRMSRIGAPFLSFSGYVDSAPFYQLYPGPVTVRASCPLKLLQYTYFDPGLQFMRGYFAQYGWNYDPASGVLSDNSATGGSDFRFGNFDVSGGIADVLKHVLIDIGGWNQSAIDIMDLPEDFLILINKAMNKELTEQMEEDEETLERLKKLFGTASSKTGEDTTSANPTTGNISWDQVARLALDAGFKGDNAIIAVAVASAESNFKTNAENLNQDASYDFGLWQINTVHKGGDTVEQFRDKMWTPRLNAEKAYAVSSQGTNWSPWVAFTNGNYARDNRMLLAAEAVGRQVLKQGDFTSYIDDQNAATDPLKPDERDTPPKATFVFPIAAFSGTVDDNYNSGRGNTDNGSHNAIDIMADEGSQLVACTDGTITKVGTGGAGGTDGGGGFRCWINNRYYYAHMNTITVAEGDKVTRGQAIGTVGSKNSVAHLHFADHPNGWIDGGNNGAVNPFEKLKKALVAGVVGIDDSVGGGVVGSSPENDLALALQAGWFLLQLQSSDTALSQALTGARALANDVSLMGWISQMMEASGRSFMSKPNGNFFAFYPDYFNYFTDTPYFRVADIELIDLTVNRNDTELTTHLFTAGPLSAPTGEINLWYDRLNSTVASVESEAFPYFINIDTDDPRTKRDEGFNPYTFLKRYGARPLTKDFNDVRNPVLLWMAGWMEFTKKWAEQYTAEAQMTFLPEIFPGSVIEFGGRITMYVQEITHTFSRGGGFSSSASLIAPGAINAKRFTGLPLSGNFDASRFTTPDDFYDSLPNT